MSDSGFTCRSCQKKELLKSFKKCLKNGLVGDSQNIKVDWELFLHLHDNHDHCDCQSFWDYFRVLAGLGVLSHQSVGNWEIIDGKNIYLFRSDQLFFVRKDDAPTYAELLLKQSHYFGRYLVRKILEVIEIKKEGAIP